MFRSILAAVVLGLPTLAAAQTCGNRDLIAELSAADRQRLDDLVAPHPYGQGILFRAEKPGSSVTVVGTIHIPDPRLSTIANKIRDDVTHADVLILEASAEDQADLQALATTRPEMFFLTEGPTLIDLLNKDEWAMISDRLSAVGIPAFFAAKFQPWYLSMVLAIPPCAMTAMQSGEQGLDARLEDLANDAGVPLATLDDVEALMALMSGDPLDKQLDGLRMGLEMQQDSASTTSTLVQGYFDGRIRETWEFGRLMIEDSGFENGAELFEEVNQALLVGRNRKWEPLIVDLTAGKNAVLAVGAAHLSGESGVLRALERAGYSISEF